MLELLVVLAIVGLASAGVGFAMRDDTQARLEREAIRLGALLEAGRARAQVSGAAVRWVPMTQGFRFEPEATAADQPPVRLWLDPDTRGEVGQPPATARLVQAQAPGSLLLGPDAIIEPQSVTLSSRAQPQFTLRLSTDGVRPFAVQGSAP